MQATHNPSPTTAHVEPTPADILRGAALYLERHGWIQGDYYDATCGVDGTPAVCALGAIAMAVFGEPVAAAEHLDRPEWREFARTRDVLHHRIGGDVVRDEYGDEVLMPTVAEWNDDPDRTPEQVIAALRAAADDWDRHHRGGEVR